VKINGGRIRTSTSTSQRTMRSIATVPRPAILFYTRFQLRTHHIIPTQPVDFGQIAPSAEIALEIADGSLQLFCSFAFYIYWLPKVETVLV